LKYLLDTCVLSDFIKGERGTQNKIKAVYPADVAVSTITMFEVSYGLENNPSFAQKLKPLLDAFFKVIQIISFDSACAVEAAKIRSFLKNRGTPIGAYDILIAATAKSNALIMVTANEKEFSFVDDLKIQNWREK